VKTENKYLPAKKSEKLALTRKTALLSLISSFSETVNPSTPRLRLGIERSCLAPESVSQGSCIEYKQFLMIASFFSFPPD